MIISDSTFDKLKITCPICFTQWTWTEANKLYQTEQYRNQREATSDVLFNISNEFGFKTGRICIPCRIALGKPEEYKIIRLKLALRS